MAEVKSINELLNMKLDIPDYQRPYKWDIQNIDDLLSDITNAMSAADRYRADFKYRIGTIILHETKKTASLYWKETMYKKHETEMLKYLMDACDIENNEG